MDQIKTKFGLSIQIKIQIWFKYLDINQDLEAGLSLDKSRAKAC